MNNKWIVLMIIQYGARTYFVNGLGHMSYVNQSAYNLIFVNWLLCLFHYLIKAVLLFLDFFFLFYGCYPPRFWQLDAVVLSTYSILEITGLCPQHPIYFLHVIISEILIKNDETIIVFFFYVSLGYHE